MPNIIDHVSYLSEEIGPRPAGTEEEQQAALYITEFMQKEAGLSTSVEDFTASSNPEMASIICGALLIVCAIIGIAVPAAGVVAVIGAFIGSALQILEALDKPVLSSLFGKGISQNVVAKYEPEQEGGDASSRHRKVVLVSHYDSGKVRAELNGPVLGLLPILKLVSLGCTVLVPILLLIKTIALGDASGAAPVVVSVLLVIALVFAVLPFISAIVHRLAAYNAGANCNASGVAVLMEAASRVGRPSSAVAGEAGEAGEAPVVHGEEAARNEGLIPDGVQVTYDVPTTPASSAEARLAQAKAAVAALSGKPVAGAAASFDISENLAQAKDKPVGAPSEADMRQFREETREAFAPRVADAAQAVQEKIAEQAAAAEKRLADAARAADSSPIEGYLEKNAPGMSPASPAANEIRITPEDMPEPVAETAEPVVEAEPVAVASAPIEEKPATGGVPDWFVRAQQNAKKPKDDGKPVHRSRYADALDAAVSESSVHFKEANEAVVSETEQRLAAMRDSIREIKAPGFEGEEADEVFSVFTQEREKIAEEKVSDLPDWSMPSWNMPASEPEKDEPITVPAIEADATPLSEEPKAAGEQRAPREKKDAPRAQAADASKAATTEQYATTAMPPIDVSDLRDKPAAAAPSAADAPVVPFVAPITDEVAKSAAADAPAEPKEDLAPVAELTKQRAPLADPSKPKNKAARRLRAQIPSILSPSEPISQGGSNTKSSEAQTALRSSLPSLSGSITREDAKSHVEDDASEDATVTLATAGTFAPASATGSFAPVDEELFENVDPDEIYVDDADDSDYEGAITETGAFAGPGYVEMPKSRVRKFFDKFHFGKHKKEEESTPQEWLDVDESFDARSVGAERGGWESFREESEFESVSDDGYDGAYDDGYEDDGYDAAYDEFDEDKTQPKSGRTWNGGAFSRISMGNANVRSGEEFEDMAALENEHTPAQEMEQIYRFHNPDITTEVWFVALGSDLSGHNGMKAFLAEHAQELRGAMIIDLEALGAGDLSLIETEGVLKKSHASSRMKRFIKKASSASGTHVGSASIEWGESSASVASKQGFQSMHLVGMDGLKPAYFGQEDDVVASVDAKKLAQSTDFVMELLKNI